MAKNGRPPASLDEWLDWKQRLESPQASGLSVSVYCLQEGVSLSRYFHWQRQLKNGIPVALLEEEADRRRAESEDVSEATFLPISLQASPVEIELPNGGVVDAADFTVWRDHLGQPLGGATTVPEPSTPPQIGLERVSDTTTVPSRTASPRIRSRRPHVDSRR
jgi:hypothetical protein